MMLRTMSNYSYLLKYFKKINICLKTKEQMKKMKY